MTLVVATAMGDTPDELYARARVAAASDADWIEVRLDGPSGLPWDLRGFFAFPKPCLATVRHADDGGRSHADDATRNSLLRRAVKAGAAAIDVEAWNAEARVLVQEAHAHGAKVVHSFHDLSGTPDRDSILGTLREGVALGADWVKGAVTVTGPQDAVALLEAAQVAREEGLPYALMAVNDPFLRLLAPTLGMSFVYGSVPGLPAAVVGQVPVDALKRAHRASVGAQAPVTPATRAAYLLGHPVSHSRSPVMQNAAFAAAGVDARYLALDVAPYNLSAMLAGLRASPPLGANVTVPHKVAVAALVDTLDATAAQAGAVNTLVFRDGRVEGHNTDGAGALDALHEAGVKVKGARTLVLGAGGAARAVAHALKGAGAEVTLTNRNPEKAEAVAREGGFTTIPWARVPDVMHAVDLLVNATTLGLHGEAVPADPRKMLPGAAVFDCVYLHGGTPLVRAAREADRVAVPGEAMLLHQGARAFRLWTGKAAPVGVMRAALDGGSA